MDDLGIPTFTEFFEAFNALEASQEYAQADDANKRQLELCVFSQWYGLLKPEIVQDNLETILGAIHTIVSTPGPDALHAAYWFGDWWYSHAEPYGSYPWKTHPPEVEPQAEGTES